MNLIVATHNAHKVTEIQSQLSIEIKLQSLLDLNYLTELEETQNTLEGNAWQKARFVYQKFRKSCFADDTGLEIEALNNEQGIYSARYASGEKSSEKIIQMVLHKLEGEKN